MDTILNIVKPGIVSIAKILITPEYRTFLTESRILGHILYWKTDEGVILAINTVAEKIYIVDENLEKTPKTISNAELSILSSTLVDYICQVKAYKNRSLLNRAKDYLSAGGQKTFAVSESALFLHWSLKYYSEMLEFSLLTDPNIDGDYGTTHKFLLSTGWTLEFTISEFPKYPLRIIITKPIGTITGEGITGVVYDGSYEPDLLRNACREVYLRLLSEY